MSRHDYLAIIGKEESRKKKKIVEEIKNYRIFASLRANVIAKIYHYMKRKEYTRGVSIYKEGEVAIDGVYFIVEGEFQVTKTIKSCDQQPNND